MMTCIIVEDEQHAQESLKGLLTKFFPEVKIAGMAGSVNEAIALLDKHTVDVVFLDVDMPEKNGFELLKQKNPVNFQVIFTTAFEHYAVTAIKYSALDYLLKPIHVDDLKEAIEKLKKQTQVVLNQSRIEVLISNLNNSSKQLNKIALPTAEGYEMIKLSDIVYCKADLSYTYIHLVNQKQHLISKPLGWLEELLPQESFFRIHKSFIINLNLISKYNRLDNYVIMETGDRIDVAERTKKDFVDKIKL